MTAADELRALAAAATPGPWDINPDQSHYLAPQVRFGGGRGGLSAHGLHDAADAELIVWLVNHAQAIADLIEYADDAVRFEHSPSHMGALADALAALEADT